VSLRGFFFFRGLVTEASLDDFTTESAAPPPESAEPAITEPVADVPQHGTEEPPVETPPVESDSPTEPALTAQTERNADGTFKPKAKEAKGKKDPQARIDHVRWEKGEAERLAERYREERDRAISELAALRQPKAEPQHRPTTLVAADPNDPEPKEEDFEVYRDFVKAQSLWSARQVYRERQGEAESQYAQRSREQYHAHRATQFRTRLGATPEEAQAAVADVHPAILQMKTTAAAQADGDRLTPMNAVADALVDSEIPAALMRYWTDHFDDFRRLLTLHPIQVIREVGKLEARLEPAPSGSGSTVPVLSSAKPPIKPVGSAPQVGDRGPLGEDASFDDHLRDYAKRTKAPMPTRRR
jgi:hypothetical protein